METDYVKIEIYLAVGIEPVRIGSVKISLSELILKNNKKDISAVIEAKIPVLMEG